jgi:hypothetical protein
MRQLFVQQMQVNVKEYLLRTDTDVHGVGLSFTSEFFLFVFCFAIGLVVLLLKYVGYDLRAFIRMELRATILLQKIHKS